MVQGDAYSIEVEITNEGQALSPPAVSLVEIALLNLVKTYPGDVTFSDGKFHFPLTQPEIFVSREAMQASVCCLSHSFQSETT